MLASRTGAGARPDPSLGKIESASLRMTIRAREPAPPRQCQILRALRTQTMAMTSGSSSGVRAEMNVTPMIDVLLVLIIIFLMITPLAPRGEEALIPQPPPDN